MPHDLLLPARSRNYPLGNTNFLRSIRRPHMKPVLTLVCVSLFLSFPSISLSSSLLRVEGFHAGQYEKARAGVKQFMEYQAFRNQRMREAIKGKLVKTFYPEVEEDVLKLLTSTPGNQINYFQALMGRLVAKNGLTTQEKVHIDRIFALFFKDQLIKARTQTQQYGKHATSRAGQNFAKILLNTHALGDASPTGITTQRGSLSTRKRINEVTGSFAEELIHISGLSEVIGATVGGAIGWRKDRVRGMYRGGQIGGSIGAWLGKKFMKKQLESEGVLAGD